MDFSLGSSELKFQELVWANEPINSGELAKLALLHLDWKKSTTYTVIKKLCEKGFLISSNAVVMARITRKEYYHMIAFDFVREYFNGSFPDFIASYRDGNQLTRDELFDMYNALKSYNEGEK